MQQLQVLMQANQPSDQHDSWTYKWGEVYQASKFYNLTFAHIQTPSVYKWLWKSACTMKTKVFAWLLLSDRLNTRDLLVQRHWKVTDDTHCELCAARAYEDRVHLFFDCMFSARIWSYLGIDWRSGDSIQAIIAHAKQSFQKPFFMEVLITATWNIWLIRNGKNFRHERPSFCKWKSMFVHDMHLLQYRIKEKHKATLLDWVARLP
jgi:hypothetical protein